MKIHYRINNPKPGMPTTADVELSKKDNIGFAKKALAELIGIPQEGMRLFGGGKELADADALIQLKFGDRVTLQVIIRSDSDDQEQVGSVAKKPRLDVVPRLPLVSERSESDYFNVGDLVDAVDHTYEYAWFPAKIVGIEPWDLERVDNGNLSADSDGLQYLVKFDVQMEDEHPARLRVGELRPRSLKKVNARGLRAGDAVFVNFNWENPRKLGFWFIADVEEPPRGKCKTLKAFVRKENGTGDAGRIVQLKAGAFEVRERIKKVDRDPGEDYQEPSFYPTRPCCPRCEACGDDHSTDCKVCSCSVCGKKTNIASIVICDECQHYFHLRCVKPKRLRSVPAGDWYCSECKRDENAIVLPGHQVKTKKFEQTRAAKSLKDPKSRDWGSGMATAGRDSVNVLKWVPSHHIGKIRGIEVGMAWQYRLQLSAFGCHRPTVSGIHGRSTGHPKGCFSIVLAGGYEDDVDMGDTVIFTGSGGRDLTDENKREAEQSKPQTMAGNNLSLAMTCTGQKQPRVDRGEAHDWRSTQPIRVFRAAKAAKHSKFAPAEGIRYDGLYHVQKYELKRGMSGHDVYLFTMKRNDPSPAPWTEDGKRRIKEMGFDKVLQKDEVPNDVWVKNFTLNLAEMAVIRKDVLNEMRWDECIEMMPCVELAFLEKISNVFVCGICHDLVGEPVNTACCHLFCLACLGKCISPAGAVNTCPICHNIIEEMPKINADLGAALKTFLVGYNLEGQKTVKTGAEAKKKGNK